MKSGSKLEMVILGNTTTLYEPALYNSQYDRLGLVVKSSVSAFYLIIYLIYLILFQTLKSMIFRIMVPVNTFPF